MKKGIIATIILLMVALQELPQLEEVEASIETIEYCISIHESWIRYIEEHGMIYPECGDIEWHRNWVIKYNQTLDTLYKVRVICQILSGEINV